MKILSPTQLKEADEITLQKQGITSVDLMERAASSIFSKIHQKLQGSQTPIKIFSGIGNNGGDGLVIARLLIEHGYKVTMYVVNYSDKRSRDFLINYDRVKNITKDWPLLITSEEDFPELSQEDLIIDAIFGVGLNRPLVPWAGNLIKWINKSDALVISIDVPSGMFADQPSPDISAIIKANYTYTLQAPKLSFFLPGTGSFTGTLETVDIGLDEEYLRNTPTAAQIIGKAAARHLYRPRKKFSHKGNYGHALIVGGSYGKMGSICLTAIASLRIGAGLATVFAPKCGYEILQTTIPEAMVITDKAEKYLSKIDFDLTPTVVCFGVGVGQEPETQVAFEKLLEKLKTPMLIDADGLNILSKNKGLLPRIPKGSVLTPHPKELERLIGSWDHDYDMLEKAKKFVQQNEVLLVIKGAYTMVISEMGIYINNSGNPGMATAGSGDVLSGVITGLIAQGYDPLTAAVFGVYLHGRAGDLAAVDLGVNGIIAGDIPKYLGKAILELFAIEPAKK